MRPARRAGAPSFLKSRVDARAQGGEGRFIDAVADVDVTAALLADAGLPGRRAAAGLASSQPA